ncbi:MAG TPA: hypothetical protein VL527_16320 [Dongiaceae bacterium]|jgi:hypothetical protein|nr:hypothetical protein [Dongiaceae bacterium]
MKTKILGLAALSLLVFTPTARACEPILPFMKVVGGPALVFESWMALLLVVAVKSTIFACSQKHLSIPRALALMLLGNVLTTIVGVLVAGLVGSGAILFLGLFIVWPLCLPPARRLVAAVKHPWIQFFSGDSPAVIMVLALMISCFLFAMSQSFADAEHLAVYWMWKLVAVYLALLVSLILTAFWEEWVVWKFSRCPAEFSGYVQPVLRANLTVLLGVMLVGAALILPQRLKSPDFLVSLVRIFTPHAGV